MSEHYIQSQYLIKQITQDFFKEDSSNIRMKDTKYVFDDNDENSIDSDDNIQEVNLDEHDNDEYHYLEDKEDLNYIFDLCDNEPDILIRHHLMGEPFEFHFEYSSGFITRGLEEALIKNVDFYDAKSLL